MIRMAGVMVVPPEGSIMQARAEVVRSTDWPFRARRRTSRGDVHNCTDESRCDRQDANVRPAMCVRPELRKALGHETYTGTEHGAQRGACCTADSGKGRGGRRG